MPSITVNEVNIFDMIPYPQWSNSVLQKYPTNDIDKPVAGYPYTGWSATNAPHTQLLSAEMTNSFVDFNGIIAEGIQYLSPVLIKRVEIIADIDPIDYADVNLLMGDAGNTTINLLALVKNTSNYGKSGYYKKAHMFWMEFDTEILSTYGVLIQTMAQPQHTVRVYQIRPFKLVHAGTPTPTYQNAVGGQPYNLLPKEPFIYTDHPDNQTVQWEGYTGGSYLMYDGNLNTAASIDTGTTENPIINIEFGRLIHLTRLRFNFGVYPDEASTDIAIFSQSTYIYSNRAIEWTKVNELLGADLRNSIRVFEIGSAAQPVWSRRIRIAINDTFGGVG